jgi:superfamily II DNA or RNA helicase
MSVRQIPVPVQGQLVTVRQRQYVVVDVTQGLPTAQREQSESTYPPLPVQAHGAPQHKVLLSSVEDDALGEELQVIWEIEPGAAILERNSLPEPVGFDEPQKLDTFLNAVRWGAVSNAEVTTLLAPFRSGIDLETYQLDPVTRAIQMPRVNLLIADDVGLGKTIEAGLVCQELIIRHRARTVLIICPAALQVQWRDQMREKFGLEFRIVDSALMHQLRRTRGIYTNPWSHFPRLITSIDFIKRPHPLRLLKALLPGPNESPYPRRFDLLILDEAHNVAPSGRQHYITDSQRTRTLRLLTPHFEHKLFLSATPHNGYDESFSALLELLDNQRFARGVEINRQQLERVMVRRLKSDMKEWDDAPHFPERRLHPLIVDYTEEERAIHRKLVEYTRLRMEHAGQNQQERFANTFVLMLLKKRLFSSPRAFLRTLERHRASLKQEKQAGYTSSPRALRNWIEEIEEESDNDEGLDEATSAAIEEAALLSQPLTAREAQLLDEMYIWAERADRRADSKARVLLNWLREHIKPSGNWSTRRVIIFTEYRATQSWLQDMLYAEGFTEGGHLQLLYGGMPGPERERIKAAFQADPSLDPLRILLATDAASEGIDLQNHCSHLIHYEIPWNPNRLEQRNGRIDRHGQRAEQVDIYHFVGSRLQNRPEKGPVTVDEVGTLDGDLEFLWIALKKVEAIRQDLGKVGPVIADQVVQAMLGESRQLRTEQAESEARRAREALKFEANIKRQIERLRQKLDESRRVLEMTPEHIQFVVETALDLANQPPLRKITLTDLRGEHPIAAFEVPALGGSWASCTAGLPHPLTGRQRPIVFDEALARGRDDVVLAHLNHRLVAMSLALLRAATWRTDMQILHRVTARVVPDLHLDTPAVAAFARLVILGGDSQRLHEELIAAGGTLRAGQRFEAMRDEDLRRVLTSATTRRVPPAWERRLAEAWPAHRERLYSALEALKRRRVKSLERHLEERMNYEVRMISDVLSELQQSIEQTLHAVVQLSLFEQDERRQFDYDREQLEKRAQVITREIESERQNIQARYASRQVYLFPVAVMFLVPERLI